MDPGIRAALCAAETATRPLAERLGGAAPFADLKPGAMFIFADDDDDEVEVEAKEEKEEGQGSRGAACTVLASPTPDVGEAVSVSRARLAVGLWGWTTTTGVKTPTKGSSDAALSWRGGVRRGVLMLGRFGTRRWRGGRGGDRAARGRSAARRRGGGRRAGDGRAALGLCGSARIRGELTPCTLR